MMSSMQRDVTNARPGRRAGAPRRRRQGPRSGRRPPSHRRNPAPVVSDDLSLRVVGRRRSGPARLILEIEVDLPSSAGQPPRTVAASPVMEPPASRIPGAERRDAAAAAISGLAGFAVVSGVASLLAIVL